ncbi:hypothetical protein E2320_001132 [Naja naja]|nr:hypothetical protein E2320_001132 [Naja naja]
MVGPSLWYKSYPIAQGSRQSPIDIISTQAMFDPSLKPLNISYGSDSSLGISNNGHSVMVDFKDIDDKTVHWNAKKYTTFGEAVAAPDGLAVIGVFLEVGEEHTSMNRLTDAFYMVKFKGTKAEFRSFNPSTLLPPSKKYWTYAGSLTTPPLHESVTWIVLKEAIQISEKQMEKFRSLLFTTEEDEKIPMVNNFRPPQPLKGRVIRASFKV